MDRPPTPKVEDDPRLPGSTFDDEAGHDTTGGEGNDWRIAVAPR